MTPTYIEIVLKTSESSDMFSIVVENDRQDDVEHIEHFFRGFMPKNPFWPSEYDLPNVLELDGTSSIEEPKVIIDAVNCSYKETLSSTEGRHIIKTPYSQIYACGCTPQAVMNF